MVTTYSERIIQDVGMSLKVLEIFYRSNGSAVEGLADSNGHRRKVLVEGKMFQVGSCIDQR